MENETGKEQYFNNFDNRSYYYIMGKPTAVKVVFYPAIIIEKQEISGHMFYEKQHEKKAGKPHNQLAAYGVRECFEEPVHDIVSYLFQHCLLQVSGAKLG